MCQALTRVISVSQQALLSVSQEMSTLLTGKLYLTVHRDISQRRNSEGKFLSGFISLLSLFFKYESLILFKLNKLMVAIGKKPAPGDHESSLKNLICKISLMCHLSVYFYISFERVPGFFF